jgi:hypothetical protein
MRSIVAAVLACGIASTVAAEPAGHFCATHRYVAASAASSNGPRLWVADLEDQQTPRVRELLLQRLPRELACGEEAVFVRADPEVLLVELKPDALGAVAGPAWGSVQRARRHAAGQLRPGNVYELPDSPFVLAFTKARRGQGDTLDETRALFLVGPRRETLLFSVRYMVVTVE